MSSSDEDDMRVCLEGVPTSFVIHSSEISRGPLLGGGDYAKVYRGKCRGMDVAVKVFRNQTISSNSPWVREAEMIRNFNHPYICLYMGICFDSSDICIVTELMDGTLEEIVFRRPDLQLTLAQRMQFALEIAQGLAWLHSCDPPIIHKDLKFENILHKNMVMKVADFGLSHFQEEFEGQFSEGNALYRAPEVFMKQSVTTKADVYALGIMLWELYTRRQAFDPYQTYDAFKTKICQLGVRPPIPAECPPHLAQLMQACWAANPDARPNMTEVVDHLKQVIHILKTTHCQAVIDQHVVDPQANLFWKSNFLTETAVDWDFFKTALYDFLFPSQPIPEDPLERSLPLCATEEEVQMASLQQLQNYPPNGPSAAFVEREFQRREASIGYNSPINTLPISTTTPQRHLLCLRWLLCKITTSDLPSPPPLVTLESFGVISSCFGPFDGNFIKRMAAVAENPWFHGWLSAGDADKLTATAGNGAYLFRFSTRSPGLFCLSRWCSASRRGIHRIYQYQLANQVYLDVDNGTPYASLQAIIASTPELSRSCENSPFVWIFAI